MCDTAVDVVERLIQDVDFVIFDEEKMSWRCQQISNWILTDCNLVVTAVCSEFLHDKF